MGYESYLSYNNFEFLSIKRVIKMNELIIFHYVYFGYIIGAIYFICINCKQPDNACATLINIMKNIRIYNILI